MVAFGLLSQNVGRWLGPTNEFCLSGGDDQPLLDVKKLNFLHSQAVRMQKLWVRPSARANEPPGETFTT